MIRLFKHYIPHAALLFGLGWALGGGGRQSDASLEGLTIWSKPTTSR